MKARLLALVHDIRASYWFIPSVMVAAAIALCIGATALDARIGSGWIESVPWLYANRPEGARGFLTTVAGSMIGVAGVTFSITIASVVYASGQYGPRLLTNFMSDRGNQVTLGTFIATFVYCLLTLRSIRAEGEAAEAAGAFVPHVAVTVGMGLAMASVGVLIFFIHHVPESIHVSNVIAGIGRDLRAKVDTLFPERIGRAEPGEEAEASDAVRTEMPEGFYDDAEPVAADGAGYVQAIDVDAMLEAAEAHDLLLRLRHRPGDFVASGDALVLAWPSASLSPEACETLRTAFAWGRHRTAIQDVRFLVNELVEIAARALSPGVNDPFTAISCLDWLSAALKCLAEREFPSADRYAADGTLRVVAEPTTFREFAGQVYGQLRPYVSADRNAALHTLKTIGEVGARASGDRRRVLRHHADAVLQGAQASLTLDADRESVAERHRLVVHLLAGHVNMQEAATEADWIGGTA